MGQQLRPMDAPIAMSPSVAEAIQRGAVVEQLRGHQLAQCLLAEELPSFRDDDDASSVCTSAPAEDELRLDAAEAAAAVWRALATKADRVAAAATTDAAAQRQRADALARQVKFLQEKAVCKVREDALLPSGAPAPAPPRAEAPAPPKPLASPTKLPREAPAPARPRLVSTATVPPRVAQLASAATQTGADESVALKHQVAGLERQLAARGAEAQRRERLLVKAKGEIHTLTYELLGMRAREADAEEAEASKRAAAVNAEAYVRRTIDVKVPKAPRAEYVPPPAASAPWRPASASATIYNRDVTWQYLKKGRGRTLVDGRKRSIARTHSAAAARETTYGAYLVDTDSVQKTKLHGLGFRGALATRQPPLEYIRGPRSPARPQARPVSAPSRRRPLPFVDDDSLRVDPEHTSPWVTSCSVGVRLTSPD